MRAGKLDRRITLERFTGPVAIVLGGSRDVWSELSAALALTDGLDRIIVAANHAGRVFDGDIDGWVTLHPQMLPAWREERAKSGRNTDFRAFVHAPVVGVDDVEIAPLEWSGSSGLFAAQVAVRSMGAAGVILCGVPMDADAGHFTFTGDWSAVSRYRPAFEAAKEAGLPVRSMSGWTAGLFGSPDRDWIDGLAIGPAQPKTRKYQAPEATMQIKFIRDRNWIPPEDRRLAVAYKAGGEYPVKRAWAEAMIAAGDAKEVRAPRRPVADEAEG
jgi:hypothetical protein